MRRIHFPILLLLCVAIYACKDNVVCPAFQSTYILDDAARMRKYSLFENDSTPKISFVSRRTKFGVRKPTTLFRKNYDLKTAPKINVLAPILEDTTTLEFDSLGIEGEFIVSDFSGTDSLGLDSLIVAPLLAQADKEENKAPKYKYRYDPQTASNYDQMYYNKYYGEMLVDTRVPKSDAKRVEELHQDMESDTTQVEKKKRFGRGRNKKEEQEEPEEEIEEVIEEDSNPVEQSVEDSFELEENDEEENNEQEDEPDDQ